MSVRKLLIRYERYFKAEGVLPGSSPTICIFGIGWHKVCHPCPLKSWHEYWCVEPLSARGLRKEKRLVLGRTSCINRGGEKIKYICHLQSISSRHLGSSGLPVRYPLRIMSKAYKTRGTYMLLLRNRRNHDDDTNNKNNSCHFRTPLMYRSWCLALPMDSF